MDIRTLTLAVRQKFLGTYSAASGLKLHSALSFISKPVLTMESLKIASFYNWYVMNSFFLIFLHGVMFYSGDRNVRERRKPQVEARHHFRYRQWFSTGCQETYFSIRRYGCLRLPLPSLPPEPPSFASTCILTFFVLFCPTS